VDVEMPDRKKVELRKSVERLFLKKFGVSPDVINEIFDSLEHCDVLIHYYLDTTASISGSFKKRINELSLKSTQVFLDFDELYITMGYHLDKVRKQVLLSSKTSFTAKEVKEFQDRVEQARMDVEILINDLKKYTADIGKYANRYD
jgi:hypothetical protein